MESIISRVLELLVWLKKHFQMFQFKEYFNRKIQSHKKKCSTFSRNIAKPATSCTIEDQYFLKGIFFNMLYTRNCHR